MVENYAIVNLLRKLILCCGFLVHFALFFSSAANGQAIFYAEEFGNDFSNFCSAQGQLADGFFSFNGVWSVEEINNGNIPNVWYISAQETGGIDPDGFNTCGMSCEDNSFINTNQTLHIGRANMLPFDIGATYTDFNPGSLYSTDARASTSIDCSGQFTITVDFWYAANANALDYCTFDYYDGTSWTELSVLASTGLCPGSVANWGSFNIDLPASANDNSDVRIGFRWRNVANNIGNPISVAIDNIELSAEPPPSAPLANFEVSGGNDDFCENNCTSFNDLTVFDPDFSTGSSAAIYEWTFTGGDISSSNLVSPIVCYDDPGSFSAMLVVTDNIGTSAPFLFEDVVNVQDCGPVIGISSSSQQSCANEQCLDFTDLSTTENAAGISSWFWTFTSASGVVITSSLQNPTNICLNEPGFYDVSLQATDPDGSEEQTFPAYIEVLDCSGPDIDFDADRFVICPGGCIELTDMSTSNGVITSWSWDLPGGDPETSTLQNPTVCYAEAGTYNITLAATDQEGISAITKTISITVDPCTGPPQAGFAASDYEICTFDCIDFVDQSLGLVEEYLWIFNGVSDPSKATSTEANPSVICYNTPGTYNVTLTVSNSNGQIDSQTYENTITVTSCISAPTPRVDISLDTICAGKCVNYTDASTGVGINSWLWSFQGAETTSSTQRNPSNICYDQPGNFDVSLFITSGTGKDSIRVFNDIITVVNTPDCRPVIDALAPDTLCAGDCANFSGVFTDADSVSWIFNGGNPEFSSARNPGLVCFEEKGEYLVIVQAFNPSGAAQPQLFPLFVGDRPPLTAGSDQTVNSGATVELTGGLGGKNPIGDFIWQPFDYVDNFQAQTVYTTPEETTQYIVYYKEPGTCTAIDTVTVFVNFVQAVGVPTAFSPNGDGQNDQLQVLGQGVARMDFKIFNRYGQLVFSTNNQAQGWDGTHNGKVLNAGSFVYTLEVLFAEGGRETYTGNVTLVK